MGFLQQVYCEQSDGLSLNDWTIASRDVHHHYYIIMYPVKHARGFVFTFLLFFHVLVLFGLLVAALGWGLEGWALIDSCN